MPFITREDGERFIIPSYRDVLSAKKTSLLRREILLLSQNYGEYIALQRKNIQQYEVAFSNEPGYLLGESVWNYFKRPQDLIYCETIPNTFEAILVIVKSGIVYLDGSFPLDVIADELLIFRSQQNSFEIYTYGDVPISKKLEEGKFSFDTSSVKSFTELPNPVFPTLPTHKAFQLQLVETVLRSKGIGIFPVKKLLIILGILGLLVLAYNYAITHKKAIPRIFIEAVDPYQAYINILTSPAPVEQINFLFKYIQALSTIPGWKLTQVTLMGDTVNATVKSKGGRSNFLYRWALLNNSTVVITSTGYGISKKVRFPNRPLPTTIYKLDRVISSLADSFSYTFPENTYTLGKVTDRTRFLEMPVTIDFASIAPSLLILMAEAFKNLPLTLTKVSISIDDTTGLLSGSIVLSALGN